MMMYLRREIRRFAELMQQKLDSPNNRIKGSWKGRSLEFLVTKKLTEEHEELRSAFEALTEGPLDGQPMTSKEDLVMECVDVANVAMMIADLAGGL